MNRQKLETQSLLISAENMLKYSLGIIKDIAALFTLEIKLAGKSLARMLLFIVIAALLFFCFWLGILSALVAWLITFHISWVLSLLLVSAVNLIAAVAIGIYILKLSSNLRLRETRHQLNSLRVEDEAVKAEN